MKRFFLPLVFLLLLSGCGFHLRGMIDVPQWLNNVCVISQSGSLEFDSMLSSQLKSYKIHVNPDPESAQYWLIINRIGIRQQIVSIGASTNPRQYQLIMVVGFLLQTKKGEIIQPETQIQISRQFTSNNDRILGSNNEESIIVNEMRQSAAIQIINRLSKKSQYHAN